MKVIKLNIEKNLNLKPFRTKSNLIILIHGYIGSLTIEGENNEIYDDSILVIPKHHVISFDLKKEINDSFAYLLLFDDYEIIDLLKDLKQSFDVCGILNSKITNYVFSGNDKVKEALDYINIGYGMFENKETLSKFIYQSVFFILKDMLRFECDVFKIFNYQYDRERTMLITKFVLEKPYKKWSIEDVSELFYVSPTTLKRGLKKEGTTFKKVILQARMSIALNLLTFSNHSILKVSSLSGFSSPAYFCESFKRMYSLTPSAFRKKSREINSLSEDTISDLSLDEL